MLTDLYRKNGIPVVTLLLAFFCIIVTLIIYQLPVGFTLAALWSEKNRPWQYISFLFVHGDGMAPRSYILLHLALNLLELITFGILIEKTIGSMQTIVVFLTQWIVTILLFFGITKGTYSFIAGITPVDYAFGMIAFIYLIKILRVKKRQILTQPFLYYLGILYLGMLAMLHPDVASGLSFIINCSGIAVGGVFSFFLRHKFCLK